MDACCVFSKLHWTYTPNQLHPHPRRYDFLDVPGRQILVFVLRSCGRIGRVSPIAPVLSLWSTKHLCAFSVAEKARAGRLATTNSGRLILASGFIHACLLVSCVCVLFCFV